MSRSDLHNSPWNSAKISTWLEPNPLQVEKAWLVVVNYLTRPLHMSREAAIFGVQVEQASHRISWPTYLLLSVNLHMELGHYFLARAKYLALWARPTQQGTRRSGRILPPSMFGIDSPNLDDPIRLVWEFVFHVSQVVVDSQRIFCDLNHRTMKIGRLFWASVRRFASWVGPQLVLWR